MVGALLGVGGEVGAVSWGFERNGGQYSDESVASFDHECLAGFTPENRYVTTTPV